MTVWTDVPWSAYDCESTGVDPMTAQIVTACLIDIDGSEKRSHTWLLATEVDIPEGASAVHGITTEYAREHGAPYVDGYKEIRQAVEHAWMSGRAIVGFNLAYDLTLLNEEGKRLGWPELDYGTVIDSYVLDRELDKYRRGKRTLGVTCEYYGIELGDDAHTADADALAAARLAWKIARRYPEIGDLDIDTLMQSQKSWHQARQDDFAAYLRRTGKDASDVSGAWPIRGVSA